MGIYSALNRLPWPRSYIGRILLVCFVGTHIPLLALSVFMIARSAATGAVFWGEFVVLLAATFVAAGATLVTVWGMMAPILAASRALEAYRDNRTLPSLPRHYTDEAGKMLIEVQETLEELNTAIHNLARAADTDALTSIGNRRWLVTRAAEQVARSRKGKAPFSLILFDLDRFKAINDRHGHATGDSVLIGVSRYIKASIAPTALFARTGGEEFCIILPATSLAHATQVAQELQAGVEAKAFASLPVGRVTASFGVASHEPVDTDFAATMARADEMLYRAKGAGRNRVVSTEEAEIA